MEKNDILKELRAKLGDSPEENEKMLKAEAEKFANEGNTDGVNAVGELLLEMMPDDRKKEIERLTHLDGLRLDEYHQIIVDLIEAKKALQALPLAESSTTKLLQSTHIQKRQSSFLSVTPLRIISVRQFSKMTEFSIVLPSISHHTSQLTLISS